jgi:S1-C subfamily serine protease
MGDPTQANIRLCPACGRRVPRSVTTCRCGAQLPDLPQADSEPEATGRSPLLIALQAIGILVLAVVVYRMTANAPQSPAVTSNPRIVDSPGPAARPASRGEPAPPDYPDPEPLPLAEAGSLEEVINRAMPAIVRVETPQGTGSAFFVRADTLITNRHVVTTNTEVTIRFGNGSSATAHVDETGKDVDLAILKVPTSLVQKVIPMSSSSRLRLGQEIILIGSPFGVLQNSVTRGIVSALRVNDGVSLVQTDAAANPGNSGGPMLDRAGNVVAVTTMSYKGAQGVNFAVAIDHARSMLDGLGTGVKNTGALTEAEAASNPPAPAAAAPVPDADSTRKQAEKAYNQALDSIGKQADEFDARWNQFRGECYAGAIAGGFDHEWFALLNPASMPGTIGGGNCTTVLAQLREVGGRFRSAMHEAEEAARRDGVFPGTLRDARRAHRLEFPW